MISNAKPFTDDTSLFSVAHDLKISVKQLNDDLKKLTIGLSNGKGISIVIRGNKPRKSFSVANQRDRPTHL